MPSFEHHVTIQRPSFDVFRYVGNFNNAPKWQTSTLAVTLTAADPVRVGTMVALRRAFMGRHISINLDVLDYQMNKVIELKGVFNIFPFHRIISFSSSGGGATHIHDQIHIRTGWLYSWYNPFLSRALGGQIRQEWDTLKRLMEARAE